MSAVRLAQTLKSVELIMKMEKVDSLRLINGLKVVVKNVMIQLVFKIHFIL